MNQQVKMVENQTEKEMFLNDFPTSTFEDWKRLVDKSLKCASFKEK
jgi:hypothetical protein